MRRRRGTAARAAHEHHERQQQQENDPEQPEDIDERHHRGVALNGAEDRGVSAFRCGHRRQRPTRGSPGAQIRARSAPFASRALHGRPSR